MARGGGAEKKEEVVVVAIDKDKSSQYALKWTVDHLITRGQTITLLHIKNKTSSIPNPCKILSFMLVQTVVVYENGILSVFDMTLWCGAVGSFISVNEVCEDVARTYKQQMESQAKDLFLPFRCFCTRKDIKCSEVILEEGDISKAIMNYVAVNSIETLVLGAASRNSLVKRFKPTDVPSTVSKGAPEFCTVYVIAKGKISSVRSASASTPTRASTRNQTHNHMQQQHRASDRAHHVPHNPYPPQDELEMRSPFTRGKHSMNKSYELSHDSDISYVSSGRPSMDHLFPSLYDSNESGMSPRMSASSDFDMLKNFASSLSSGHRSIDLSSSHYDFSHNSHDSGKSSSSQNSHMDEVEAEMKRLRLELKQTMDMYSTACKEALSANKKAIELHRWKMEEEQKLEEARLAEEAALALAEKEKAKCKAAIEAAEAAQRLAELEAQKRIHAEMRAQKEAEERKKALGGFAQGEIRYRKYTIEEIETATQDFAESRKIGEGGYGPVYRGELDHTPVAIKILRPDAAQGRSQFQQEVEVLSCIRHPNMVLLLGACPEFGCLVYEYMANGSLEDRLFRRGNTPVLSWQLRFRIAAEIGTGLLFLHQTKPEPLVHRDLKPANILLDRNYVSKISDVGLARLVPPSVADSVTQYRMTATAGTFCYIDPEYQQTGMLGIKSDIYSLGVLFLQMITAKPPMGLTHHMERAIERGTFEEMLDPAVTDWPVEEALNFVKLALQCSEMRRKDRPDLGKIVLPELNRLRELAEDNMFGNGASYDLAGLASKQGSVSTSSQVVISDPQLQHSESDSPRSRSSTSSSTERI
ncbi:Phosphorylase kinase, gamma catalytic subunit [Parasponia andersonii]|uniref:RING-type E3 ubiquitin transferase n=1 Tax=Parasponia andersonii TaxID=3476 RepID=A0A2P5AX59_PARAD|nr:Phosphorylase kinase, gamma catalytic subunit [Parasponia andersonii]